MMKTGLFPAAVVRPRLKESKLDFNDFNNFRTVSNLPFLEKPIFIAISLIFGRLSADLWFIFEWYLIILWLIVCWSLVNFRLIYG